MASIKKIIRWLVSRYVSLKIITSKSFSKIDAIDCFRLHKLVCWILVFSPFEIICHRSCYLYLLKKQGAFAIIFSFAFFTYCPINRRFLNSVDFVVKNYNYNRHKYLNFCDHLSTWTVVSVSIVLLSYSNCFFTLCVYGIFHWLIYYTEVKWKELHNINVRRHWLVISCHR